MLGSVSKSSRRLQPASKSLRRTFKLSEEKVIWKSKMSCDVVAHLEELAAPMNRECHPVSTCPI